MKAFNTLFVLACFMTIGTTEVHAVPPDRLPAMAVDQNVLATCPVVTVAIQQLRAEAVPMHTEESSVIQPQLLLNVPPMVYYASFNPFSSEQECCGGSGGWQSPYLRTTIAFTLLALLGFGLYYRLRHGTRLPWTRH